MVKSKYVQKSTGGKTPLRSNAEVLQSKYVQKSTAGKTPARSGAAVFQSKDAQTMPIKELCVLGECKKAVAQKTKEFYREKANEKAKALLAELSKAFELFEKLLNEKNGLIEIADGIFYLKDIHAIFPDPKRWKSRDVTKFRESYNNASFFEKKFGSYKGSLFFRNEIIKLQDHRTGLNLEYSYAFSNSQEKIYADLAKKILFPKNLKPSSAETDATVVETNTLKNKLLDVANQVLKIQIDSPLDGFRLDEKGSSFAVIFCERRGLYYSAAGGYDSNARCLPVFRLGAKILPKVSNLEIFQYFLCDEEALADLEFMRPVREVYRQFTPYIKLADDAIAFDTEAFVKDFEKGAFPLDLNGKGEQTFQQLVKDVLNGDTCSPELRRSVSDCIKDFYLHSDARRVQLEPYGEDLLFEHTQGHWDLAVQVPSGSGERVQLEPSFYARNPRQDIQHGSLIGIDFGTKSTVVSCLDKRSQIFAIPVGKQCDAPGTGDGGKDIYENPTIMHFCNLDAFMQAYRHSQGRPETTWQDMSVAHTANSKLSEANDANYYSFISTLKQWAAAGEKMRLIDAHGVEKEVPPYLACQSDDIDPIELYAYYIGMAINNMRQGVYINYLLSFPVTYEKAIREKILASFRRGLRKSLPQILAADDEFINKEFRVISGTSEPAAYAVCALESFGFKPKDQEVDYYGVFDFGGGTTDFDFGKWRAAITDEERDRYEHVIEHFGAGGEKFLGGENLLDHLAFAVFSCPENWPKLKQKNVYFTWPRGGAKKFDGHQEVIAKDSKWAHLNMQRMREELRPIWERHPQYQEKFKENQLPLMRLFTNSGAQVTDMPGLAGKLEELDAILESKIRDGVTSFMNGMLHAMAKISPRPTKINVFLAGNSCRSAMVEKIFAEAFQAFEARFKERLEKQGRELEQSIFELFPPLGTEAAKKKQVERGCWVASDGYAPTGKTGVAIGLLKCRTGVKVVDANKDENDEIAFQFVIGKMRAQKLIPVLTFASKLNGKWERFIGADEAEFDFYYTTKKSGLSGELSIHETERYTCPLANPDSGASVYMRPKSPTEIEYVVARANDVEAGRYLSEVVTIKLSGGK